MQLKERKCLQFKVAVLFVSDRHVMADCWRKDHICRICNRLHHYLICESELSKPKSLSKKEAKLQYKSSLLCNEDKINKQNADSVSLQIFTTVIKSKNRNNFSVWCLCDGGSIRTFIKKKIVSHYSWCLFRKKHFRFMKFGFRE